MEKIFREFRKHKEWCIRGKDQLAVEKVSYRQMLDYCEVIYYMGITDITVEYLADDKVYIFKYDYDLDDVIFESTEEY
jgi:hypothetical protein